MSQLYVDNIRGRLGGAVGAPAGLVVTGVGTFSGSVSVGGTLTYEDVANIDSVGVITARAGINVSGGDLKVGSGISLTSGGNVNAVGIVTGKVFAGYDSLQAGYFDIVSGPTPDPVIYNVTYDSKDSTHRYFGQGSGLGYKINGVFAPWLTLTPGRKYRFLMSASDMSAHPFRFYKEADKTTEYTDNVTSTATYTEILVTDSTPQVLHYQCSLHGYMGNGVSTLSNIAGSSEGGGISTSATSASNTVTTLDLSSASEHKLTATGIVTVTVSGGTEGDTHIVRVINSGIATVGFSTFFLFPSGSVPILPTADGSFSQISFQVNRVGAAGTQLFATAALNFS